ncbi:MAG: tRNA (adenosine(37)-N6)-threonylcarbamoyltransferase complex dimerization subunit type 1 TsaB [Thermoanaerobacteraceae bacterium]|nr:tRNA (adenosine(37)-N6)-threonylcarbamoyltransferase complex dimerization subunit type 1 TsaB [Thermoanaerobacteraceae bacterium]
MLVLGIETSTSVVSAALVDAQKLLAEVYLDSKEHHSRRLLPVISSLLEEVGVKIKDLAGIAVALGPGSFTGLRIGLATAKGLAHAGGKPLVGVPTLDALALNAAGVGGLICPVVVARRQEVYTALYRWQEGRLHCLVSHQAVNPSSWVLELASYGEPVYFLGDAVMPYKKVWEELQERAVFLPPENALPRAAQIARQGQVRLSRNQEDDLFQLKPLYLRPSAAELKA